MKRALLAFVSTVAALVMLLSFKTHATSALTTPPAALKSASGATSHAGATSRTGTVGKHAGTFTGDPADTPFGPVQVRITVAAGRLTGVTAVDYPNGSPRDAEINAYAIPALNSEATAAGNARIDMISGATYTSEGYLTSLQSALNNAGL